MKKNKYIKILKIISVLMLLFALGNNPYSYYQILRWVVCGVTGYSAYLSYQNNNVKWTWIFAIIAVLYNPISTIHLARETWEIVNVITIAFIAISLFKNNTSKIK